MTLNVLRPLYLTLLFFIELNYPLISLLIAAEHVRISGHDAFTFEQLYDLFRIQVRMSSAAPVAMGASALGMVNVSRGILMGVSGHSAFQRFLVTNEHPGFRTTSSNGSLRSYDGSLCRCCKAIREAQVQRRARRPTNCRWKHPTDQPKEMALQSPVNPKCMSDITVIYSYFPLCSLTLRDTCTPLISTVQLWIHA